MGLQFNGNNNINEVYYNGVEVIHLNYNGVNVWNKGSEPPTSSYDYQVAKTYQELTTIDKIQYSYVYGDSKWYSLNNTNQYEEWGIYEETDDINTITTYNGKLAFQGNSEYEYSNNQWNYLGDKTESVVKVINLSATTYNTPKEIDLNEIRFLKSEIDATSMSTSQYATIYFASGTTTTYQLRIYPYKIKNNQTSAVSGKTTTQTITGRCSVEGDYYVVKWGQSITTPKQGIYRVTNSYYNSNKIALYEHTVIRPKQYDTSIFNDYELHNGYPYNSLDDIEHKGKNIIYNIDGYLYQNGERTTINPYNLYSELGTYGCLSGTSISEIKLLDENIDVIGERAFGVCSGLTSVTIGNSVRKIGDYVFSSCSNLTSITIGNSVTSIGKYAFYNCSGLTSIEIPNSVTTIDEYAFFHCSGLTSVNISNSVTSISQNAFNDCSSLTSIEIPNSVKSIGNGAFANCSGLTSIEIPNSVKSIGYNAFACTNVKTFTINKNSPSVISVTTSTTYNPFGEWRTSESITKYCGAKVNNPKIICPKGTLDNYLNSTANWFKVAILPRTSSETYGSITAYGYGFTVEEEVPLTTKWYNGDTLIKEVDVVGELTSDYKETTATRVEIGSDVTSIGDLAFLNCYDLTSVTIPNSVTSIKQSGFANCRGLARVNSNVEGECIIPNSVTSIGTGAFQTCESLTSVIIPNSVKTINRDAFHNSSGITSVTMSNQIESIGHYAFTNCNLAQQLHLPNTITYFGSKVYAYNDNLNDTIIYDGTYNDFFNITSESDWFAESPLRYVKCTDWYIDLYTMQLLRPNDEDIFEGGDSGGAGGDYIEDE